MLTDVYVQIKARLIYRCTSILKLLGCVNVILSLSGHDCSVIKLLSNILIDMLHAGTFTDQVKTFGFIEIGMGTDSILLSGWVGKCFHVVNGVGLIDPRIQILLMFLVELVVLVGVRKHHLAVDILG